MSFMECTAMSIVAGQQRLLDLLGEETLAAGLGQRPVLDAVARGPDGAHLECQPAGPVRCLQALAHLVRLRQRQWRAARADTDGRCLQALVVPMLGGAGHQGRVRVMPPSGRRCKRSPMHPTANGYAPETLVLGIETSCDETAAAVVARAGPGRGRILSNVVRAQWEQHRRYGGVVPEIAARAHVECLDEIIVAGLARGRHRSSRRSMPSR